VNRMVEKVRRRPESVINDQSKLCGLVETVRNIDTSATRRRDTPLRSRDIAANMDVATLAWPATTIRRINVEIEIYRVVQPCWIISLLRPLGLLQKSPRGMAVASITTSPSSSIAIESFPHFCKRVGCMGSTSDRIDLLSVLKVGVVGSVGAGSIVPLERRI
jgi:hypothetical protein